MWRHYLEVRIPLHYDTDRQVMAQAELHEFVGAQDPAYWKDAVANGHYDLVEARLSEKVPDEEVPA